MTSTAQELRRLPWEACYNARDLGGYSTTDGRETRPGAVVRCDDLSQLTDAGRQAVIDYGIRTVVDLRTPGELENDPPPFAVPGDHGITYHNLSFVSHLVPALPEVTSLAQDYIGMLGRFRPQVVEILRAIAEAPEGGILIHCHAGKDRTGLTSALLLALAGVPDETIAEDYAISVERLRPIDEKWLENGPGERAERERIARVFAASPQTMLDVLAHLREEYGSVEAYLLGAGLTGDEVEELRDRLLADHQV